MWFVACAKDYETQPPLLSVSIWPYEDTALDYAGEMRRGGWTVVMGKCEDYAHADNGQKEEVA